MGLRIFEVVDVGAVELARALTDPQEVRRGVVRRAGARVDAGHRALVVHQQTLVPRVELDAAKLVEVGARRLHELDRSVDLGCETLVLLVGGFCAKPLFQLCTSRRSANPPCVNARMRLMVDAAVW
jgi:hypothetical protein